MKIKIFKNSNLLKEYDISKGLFVLGRAEDCDLCVLDDLISRKHVEFRYIDDKNIGFSKKTKFGELLKDGQVVEEGRLGPGESLDIGDIKISFGDDLSIQKKDKEDKKSDFELFTMSVDSDSLPDLKEQLDAVRKSSEITIDEKSDEIPEPPSEEKIVEEKSIEERTDEPKKEVTSSTAAGSFGDETMVGPARLLYQLVAISGPYKDKVFPLEKESVTLGRSNKTGIVLVDDLVSREHARIYRQGVDSLIVDLNSANGVKVNGKKIADPLVLSSGDIIEVGSSAFRFMAINPQVQSVKGVTELSSSRNKPPVIEKVADLSETQIKKIERSYGFEDEEKKRSKKTIFIIIGAALALVIALIALSGDDEEAKRKAALEAEKKAKDAEAALVEQVPEVKCLEEGLCHLPLAVQKDLQTEYNVGIGLFKNYQYELAEDRAHQILEKAPDWGKAQELLRVASESKEQLLAQKAQEEEAAVRKMLEDKIAKLVQAARSQMAKGQYDELKATLASIFEVDPNNKEAKAMADRLEEMAENKRKAMEKKSQLFAAVQSYKKIFADGKKFYEQKAYLKAIETFQKCLSLPSVNNPEVESIKSESKTLLEESKRLLKEAVAPELAVAEQALMSSQYREAIASYQRVLKMDYKNKTAKTGLEKAKTALNETAKDYFSRALIAESISDFKTACMYYNAVVETAIPGTRYYVLAMEKVRKRCEKGAQEK